MTQELMRPFEKINLQVSKRNRCLNFSHRKFKNFSHRKFNSKTKEEDWELSTCFNKKYKTSLSKVKKKCHHMEKEKWRIKFRTLERYFKCPKFFIFVLSFSWKLLLFLYISHTFKCNNLYVSNNWYIFLHNL